MQYIKHSLRTSEIKEIIRSYKQWLKTESANVCHILADTPENFLVYLEYKNLLNMEFFDINQL